MPSFVPTAYDVHRVRHELTSRKLPVELVLQILDHARYWVERRHEVAQHVVLMDEEFSREYSDARPYLAARAFPHTSPFNSSGEAPRIKEIEFLIVSHGMRAQITFRSTYTDAWIMEDQGWTTEETKGTFQTSSWSEVSILRPRPLPGVNVAARVNTDRDSISASGNVETAVSAMFPEGSQRLVPRPAADTETQRQHCSEMMLITQDSKSARRGVTNEGQHTWYLQGNEVARPTSVFDGEMVRRYSVVWGSKANPRWEGNEGSGHGQGFIESINPEDWIVIWARAKVSAIKHWVSDDDAKSLTDHHGRDAGGKITFMAFA